MFWSFSLVLSSGVTVTYWKLINVSIEVGSMTGICTAYGYLDEDSYNSGKKQIVEKDYVIDFTSLSQGGALVAGVVNLVQTSQNAG